MHRPGFGILFRDRSVRASRPRRPGSTHGSRGAGTITPQRRRHPGNRSARFWDRIAERYARRPVADQAAYQHKLDVTRRYLRPHMQVLEFGCGTGSTALVHAPLVDRYQAIDVSPKMIEIAERKLAETPVGNPEFAVAAIEDLQVEDASLDAVLGLNVLHLLDDRNDAIRRVHAMLKPGGVFVSSTACLKDTMPWLRLIAPVGKWLRLLPHVEVFARQDLRESLQRTGFRIDCEIVPPNQPSVLFLAAVKPK